MHIANIPDIDLPRNNNQTYANSPAKSKTGNYENIEPLPESGPPRKDGPGGA